jgi:hypothetical protein
MSVSAATGLRGERLGPVTLVREGLARIAAAPIPLALLLLANGAVNAAIQRQVEQQGVALTKPETLGPYAAYVTANAVVSGLAGAMALRATLRTPEPWWRPDLRLLQCAGLLALTDLAFDADAVVMVGVAQAVPGSAVAAFVAGAAFYPVLAWVFTKLMLWPIGRLTGRSDVTPGASWAATRGLVLSWLGARLITALPMVLVGVPLVVIDRTTTATSLPVQFATRFLSAAGSLVGAGMAAAFYDRRFNAGERLAAMFD